MLWKQCGFCTLCDDDPDWEGKSFPTPIVWGPIDAPVLIVGDAWLWNGPAVSEPLGVFPVEMHSDPQFVGDYLYEYHIQPRLEATFGKLASQIAYTPAARCSFGEATDTVVSRCSVYTKNAIEGRAVLALGPQGYSQLLSKPEFESGRLISHDRLGIVLMFDRLHRLLDGGPLSLALRRGMTAVGIT